MDEHAVAEDLRARGVWRIAPGLWCDKSVPDMILVAPEVDTAISVRAALDKAQQLPPIPTRSSDEPTHA